MLFAPFDHFVHDGSQGEGIAGEFIFDRDGMPIVYDAKDQLSGFKIFQFFGEHAGGDLRNVALDIPEPAFACVHRHQYGHLPFAADGLQRGLHVSDTVDDIVAFFFHEINIWYQMYIIKLLNATELQQI